ncbi:MAG: hypothetical protein AAFW89_03190 [Bacteroidota bacterium]
MKSSFSEQEVQAIIKRAAELQKQQAEQVAPTSNLSLEELKEIGKTSGLDPALLEIAASEIGSSSRSDITIEPSDTHIFEERQLITQADHETVWDEMVAELRHHFGSDAFGRTVNHNHEWMHTSMSGVETVATIKKRPTGYQLRLSQRVGLASSLTEGVMYGGILAFVLSIVAELGADFTFIEGSVLFTMLFVCCSILVYTLDIAWRKKKNRRLNELASKIQRQVGDLTSSGSPNIHIEDRDVRSDTAGQDLGDRHKAPQNGI